MQGPPGPPGPPGANGSSYVKPDGPEPAYSTFVPTIKSKLKPDQLPKWDGNKNSALEYFWDVQQLAALGGYMPQALGYWLWKGLKEGSAVRSWFATLSLSDQQEMREDYVSYLNGIKNGYLGQKWQMHMNWVFESQYFRPKRARE